MKLFRKLVAVVAMMACCITMVTPVTAKAALTICSHDGARRYGEKAISNVVDDHVFTITMDSNGDKIPESYYGVCEVIVISHCSGFTCVECKDYIVIEVYDTEVIEHSLADICPFAQ